MKPSTFSESIVEIKFGAWRLNPKQQTINDGVIERELEPLLFKILSYLILNKESIITRQDLIDDVWCQHYVDDNAINRAISELRKVLKSEKQRSIVVKTHYRKGYSFFLEPEIIYHEDGTPSFSQVNVLKETPNKKQKMLLGLLVVFTLIAFIGFYIVLNVLEPSDIGPKNIPPKVKTKSLNVVKKKFKEEVLSWRQGVYSRMLLSPDSSTVALTLLEKEQLYSSLLIKNLHTGQERIISEANANIFPAGWSIDGQRAIYSMEAKGKCGLWEVALAGNTDSKFLFECKPSDIINAINIGSDSFVYSKYGYRNRSELSVLVNLNLSTGEEFQISSPNLNSYGDKLLYFIKNKKQNYF